MANLAHTTILPASMPSAPPVPAVVYIPEIHKPKSSPYIPELRTGDTTKATIVADIASSDHEDVSRVIAFDLAAGTSWDASKEIAQAVLDAVLTDYPTVPTWCIDFLEQHLGVNYVRRCEREAA